MNTGEESQGGSAALALKPQAPGFSVARWREATDVAEVCREIVKKRSKKIGDRQFVQVEGWTSIAVAHGCIASVKPGSVAEILRDGKVAGIRAVAEIRRQSDGVVLSEAEGYVGDDELDWFGSKGEKVKRYSKKLGREIDVVIPKRADYAIRSMAQTRAVSKACRNAFSHVVILIDEGLSTTPYEEMAEPDDSVDVEATSADAPKAEKKPEVTGKPISVPRELNELEKQFEGGKWKKVKVHFGNNRDRPLEDLQIAQIQWYSSEGKWEGGYRGEKSEDDLLLRAAADVATREAR